MVLNKSDKTEMKFSKDEWTRIREKFSSYTEDGIRFNIQNNEPENYDILYITGLKQLGNEVGSSMSQVAKIMYDEIDGGVILKIINNYDVEMILNFCIR
jgi:hypothetical protein